MSPQLATPTAQSNRSPLQAPPREELVGRTWTPTDLSARGDELAPCMRPARTPYGVVQRDGATVVALECRASDESVGAEPLLFPADGRDLAITVALLEQCDGRATVAELATRLGFTTQDALLIVRELYRQALVWEAGDTEVPALLFLDHIRSASASERVLAFRNRPGVEAMFGTGSYTPRLALGYLVEAMHFIKAAASHIGPAIAHSSRTSLQMMFSEYLAEEHWHGLWMERSLRAAGLGDADIARATPLPATTAVVNNLRVAAHTDVLSYSALLAITESDAPDPSIYEQLFQQVVDHGVLPREVWLPYFQHAHDDGECDHLAYGREVFAQAGMLARFHQDQLRRRVMQHTRSCVLMEHAICDFYGAVEGPRYHSLDW